MSADSMESLNRKVRDSASLMDRLEEVRRRIGKMCSEHRGPRMSIPVEWHDDDVFIAVTVKDAMDALPSSAELERDAGRYQWLRKLKSGRPESQIALARVVLALREMPEKMDVFIDEQIVAMRDQP